MPVHAEDRAGMAVYTVAMCAITGGVLLWWAASPQRRRDPALLYLLAGGAIAGCLEPFLDNVVLFWYPPHQHLVAFHAIGRTVPLFVPIGYAWFCGSLLYLVARIFQRGVRERDVWALLGAVAVIDFVAIGLTSWLGIAGFYGSPPFDIGGYPLWWAAFDGTDVILGGAIVYYLLPRLPGRSRLWLLLAPPFALGIATGAVGWPITTALNTPFGTAGKWLAGTVTIGLGLVVVFAVARVVTRLPAVPPEDSAPIGIGKQSDKSLRIY
jgi:hypothetical protein